MPARLRNRRKSNLFDILMDLANYILYGSSIRTMPSIEMAESNNRITKMRETAENEVRRKKRESLKGFE